MHIFQESFKKMYNVKSSQQIERNNHQYQCNIIKSITKVQVLSIKFSTGIVSHQLSFEIKFNHSLTSINHTAN